MVSPHRNPSAVPVRSPQTLFRVLDKTRAAIFWRWRWGAGSSGAGYRNRAQPFAMEGCL